MNLTLIFQDPKFRDKNERDYAVSILEAWEWSIAKVFFSLAVFSWIPPVFAFGTGGLSDAQSTILINYSILRTTFIAIVYFAGKLRSWSKPLIFWMMIISQLVWTYAALIGFKHPADYSTITRSWILLMFVGNLFMPLRSWAHHAILAISMPTFAMAMWHHPYAELAIAVAFFAIVFAQSAQIFMHRMLKDDAIRTYREKSKYIPRQVLMEAAREKRSIKDVFKPAKRFCVCICADWRNLKDLLGAVDETKLGNGLVQYYRQISELLEKHFPQGNYFIDWIADELFIVAFATEQIDEHAICRAASDLIDEMRKSRAHFTKEHGYPSGIDIGITAGDAIVGVFGHDGIAKATAFGETPGIARRLQSVSKKSMPTSRIGDRIITSQKFYSYLDRSKTPPITIRLPEPVKDLNETCVLAWISADRTHSENLP